MDRLQVRLFGELSIQRGGQPVHVPFGKALELFCFLLVYRDRAHHREILSEVLWPDGQSTVSKRYLRQALWRLNATVPGRPDPHRAGSGALLSIGLDCVRVNPDADLWLDVSSFERTYTAVRDVPGHRLSDRQAQDLEGALELYRGDLLASWYHEWCGHERDRLQLVYLAMLDQLMGYCESRGLCAKGLGLGQAGLRHDPARECTHRQLMRLHYRAGDRTAALRQYERCASVMAREFGIGPSAGTEELYEQICADRVPDIPVHSTGAPGTRSPVPDPPEATELADLHERLDEIQASLLALHESVLRMSAVRAEYARTAGNGSSGSAGGLLGIGGADHGEDGS